MDAVYFAGNIIFYIFLLSRISALFKLKKYVLYGLAFLIFISAVASIAYCICLPLISPMTTSTIDTEIWAIIRGTLSIDDLILNMVILIVFAYKMRKTVASIDVTASDQAAKNANLITNLMIKHS